MPTINKTKEFDRVLSFKTKGYSLKQLVDLYKAIIKPRLIEEKMLLLLRQGKISKWFSGIGQEAVACGTCEALETDEYILPMHRNLGVFTSRNIPLHRLFSQWQGKASGFTKGRDRSFHFGTNDYHLVGMISHLGPQLSIADGIALANKLNNDKKVTMVFSGDGGSSQGEFHEALNVAAVWNLPVIFVIENNGYGLSTPSSEQFACKQFIDKGVGYGMKAVQVDGNNILEVHSKVKKLAADIRKDPHPVILECMTFRMRGHEEASGVKYVPKELLDKWAKKDPVLNYEQFLLEEEVLNEGNINEIKETISKEIEEALDIAFAEEKITPSADAELGDVYKHHEQIEHHPRSEKKTEKRLIDAIADGLDQACEKHDNLVLMGQDIAEYGGVFKATQGLLEKYGEGRIRNTPLCESAIIGAALGLSIKNFKSMVEMQFADFVTCGFNQIVNNLAKIHYRWAQNADVVVRMPTGAGVAAGPFHSQSNEAWFFHVPGLKIVYPAFPADAKGLLLASFEDPNPVMFFEHKALYRSIREMVPDDYYTTPIGKASVVREGEDISIITYGMGVHWVLKEADKHKEASVEIIDLRTLLPWDKETVFTSVRKTGKVIVLHEDTITGGIGAEISAVINENLFENLDAPVMRCGSLDTPVPFDANLEIEFLPAERFSQQLAQLLAY